MSLSASTQGCQGNIVHAIHERVRYTAPPTVPADILMTLGQRAREHRQRKKLTLRTLAGQSGLSLRFLMDVEAGRGNISVRRLAALAAALDVQPGELLSLVERTPARPRVIALLGIRGAGKTTIGRRLARRMRCRFVELDGEVERRAGLPSARSSRCTASEYYRRLEHESLEELFASGRPAVLAVGGGLVTAPDTYALLRRSATTVWLKARPEDYWRRVLRQGDRRPIDQHPHAREALRQLVGTRDPLYAQADLVMNTTSLSVARAIERLSQMLA